MGGISNNLNKPSGSSSPSPSAPSSLNTARSITDILAQLPQTVDSVVPGTLQREPDDSFLMKLLKFPAELGLGIGSMIGMGLSDLLHGGVRSMTNDQESAKLGFGDQNYHYYVENWLPAWAGKDASQQNLGERASAFGAILPLTGWATNPPSWSTPTGIYGSRVQYPLGEALYNRYRHPVESFKEDPAGMTFDTLMLLGAAGGGAASLADARLAAEVRALSAAGDAVGAAEALSRMSTLGREVKFIRDARLAKSSLEAGLDTPSVLRASSDFMNAAAGNVPPLRPGIAAKLLDKIAYDYRPIIGVPKGSKNIPIPGAEQGIYLGRTIKNPLLRAVFQKPLDAISLEEVGVLRRRLGSERETALQAQNIERVRQIDAQLARLDKWQKGAMSPALGINLKQRNWFWERRAKMLTDKIVGHNVSNFYQQRNEVFKEIANAVDENLPKEGYQTAASWLTGDKGFEHLVDRIPVYELEPIVQSAGFETLHDAGRAMNLELARRSRNLARFGRINGEDVVGISRPIPGAPALPGGVEPTEVVRMPVVQAYLEAHPELAPEAVQSVINDVAPSPEVSALDGNVQASIRKMIADGQIAAFDPLDYQPPPEVAALPQRAEMLRAAQEAMGLAGIPDAERQAARLVAVQDMFAQIAAAISGRRGEPFDISSWYDNTAIRFRDHYEPVVGERLSLLSGDFDFQKVAEYIVEQLKTPKGMRAARWYEDATAIKKLFRGKTVPLVDGTRVDMGDFILDVLGVTSGTVDPKDQMLLALQIAKWAEEGKLIEKMFAPVDVPIVFDDDPAFGSKAGVKMFVGEGSGTNIQDVREVLLGWGPNDSARETLRHGLLEEEATLAKLRAAKNPNAAEIAYAEEVRNRILIKAKEVEADISQPVEVPWRVVEHRLRNLQRLSKDATTRAAIAEALRTRVISGKLQTLASITPSASNRMKERDFTANLKGRYGMGTVDRRDMHAKTAAESKHLKPKKKKVNGVVVEVPSKFERTYGYPPPPGIPTELSVPAALLRYKKVDGGIYYFFQDMTSAITELVNEMLLSMGETAPMKSITEAAIQSVVWHYMKEVMHILTAPEREFLANSRAKVFVTNSGTKIPREDVENYIKALDLTTYQKDTVNYEEALRPILEDPAYREIFKDIFNREVVDKYINDPSSLGEKLQQLAGQVVGRYIYGEGPARAIEFFTGATLDTPPHELGHQMEEVIREFLPEEHMLLTAASLGADSSLLTRRGIEAFLQRSIAARGGTADVLGGADPVTGYAVARGEGKTTGLASGEEVDVSVAIDPDTVTVDQLLDYAIDRLHLFIPSTRNPGQPDAYLGIWVDADEKWWLDVTDVFPTKTMGLDMGKYNNQQYIWDNVRGEAIESGGTGGNHGKLTPLDRSERTAAAARAARPDVQRTEAGMVERVGGGDPGFFAPWSEQQSEWLADQLANYAAGRPVNPIVQDIFDGVLKDAKELFPGYHQGNAELYNGLERPYREITLPRGLLSEGDPSSVIQGLSEEQILPTARAAQRPIGQSLREIFGHKFVKSRVKSTTAASDAAEIAGGMDKVTDILGHRVIVGSWLDVDDAVKAIGEKFIVRSIEDLRPGVIHGEYGETLTAKQSGYRGVRMLIEDRRYPGLVSEVEIGTALFDQTREASSLAGRVLRRGRKIASELQDRIDNGEPGEIDKLEFLQRKLEMHRLRVTGIWEHVADELDHQLNRVTPISTPHSRTQMNYRLLIAKYFEEAEIAAGFDPAFMLERQYLPKRRLSGTKWNGAKKTYEGGKSATQLAQEDAAAGRPQPIYFPEIDLRKHRLTDFLGPSRSKIGMAGNNKKTYLNKNRSVVANSEGGIWENPEMMTDVRSVLQIRAAKALKNISSLKLAEEIFSSFARPIESVDEVGATEQVFSLSQIREIVNRQIDFDEAYADALGRMEQGGLSPSSPEDLGISTEDWPEAFKAEIKSVMEGTDIEKKALVEALVSSLLKANRRLAGVSASGQLYAIPRVVGKRISDSVLPSSVWGRLIVDKPTQLWRTTTLALAPRWVLNNVVGNTVSMLLQGARFTDMLRYILDRDFRELVQAIAPEGTFGGFFQEQQSLNRNLGMAANNPVGRLYAGMANNRAVHALGAPARWIMFLNSVAEDASRAAVFLKAVDRQQVALKLKKIGNTFWSSKKKLEKLAVEGMTPGAARAALDEVNYFLNDYRTLSPFEKKYIRRFVAPFWSFHKHMARLAITFPFEYPLRALLVKNLAMFANDMQEEYGPLPTWLEGAIPFGPGKDGKERFLNTRGPNPFSGLLESPISLLHPGLKTIYDWLQGRSSFTGREFTDENTVQDFVTGMKFRFDRNSDGSIRSVEQVDKVRPPFWDMLLENIPQYGMAKDLIAGAATYDTATLIDVIRGKGTIMDNDTGKPMRPYDAFQILMRYLGISTTDYDITKYQTETYPDALNRSIKAYLQRVGQA